MSLDSPLHDAVGLRLAGVDQRYTRLRQALVEALAGADRPLTIPEILAAAPQMPQSSAYRNVTTLIEAGVVRRVAGNDDHGRFELSEEFSSHHHHLVCSSCGRIDDVAPSQRLERALSETAKAASEYGYQITDHQVELVGTCPDCS